MANDQWRSSLGGTLAGLALLCLPLLLLLFPAVREWLQAGMDAVGGSGYRGALLFILLYAVTTVSLVPCWPLKLGSGAVFGLWAGSLLVVLGAALGSAAAFLAGRHALRRPVQRWVARSRRLAAVDRAVDEQGWRVLFLVRLSAVPPFGVMNYALGLTRVGFWRYLFWAIAGLLPGIVLYVYLGTIGRAGLEVEGRSAAEWAGLAVGLAATIAVTVLVTVASRRALAESAGLEE